MKLFKSQTLSEYSICLAVILAVIFGMQIYVKRGLARRYKKVANHASTVSGAMKQHKPYYTEEKFEVKQSYSMSDKMEVGGGRDRKYKKDVIEVKGESLQKVTYKPFASDLRLPGLF
ncbi:MAG: hypothetical protein KAJ79_01945 [Candidatus Omnitrophica bacterium]|nr:hypothetical protein [Candidatus Omnitrophota bacterium]MCK5287798.1 hypothetical protein [Candidatus Omnitrophota bacterium]